MATKMKRNATSVDAKPFDVDVKRFYVPGHVLVSDCPKCGHTMSRDYGYEYLSYPTANEDFDETCYCGECGHEWDVTLRLSMALDVVDGTRRSRP